MTSPGSARSDTLIKGGTIATSDGVFRADLAIGAGRIRAIGADLPAGPAEVIDASGLLVLPGGIDVHTHFDTEIGGARTADDFESGTRAAAAGGITTVINFAIQEPGSSLTEAVADARERAEGTCHVDFGLHVGVTDCGPVAAAEVESLAAAGFTSFKMFTALGESALTDREALSLLEAVAGARCLLTVHAEDGALIDHVSQRLLADGRRTVRYLNEARPASAEAIAVARIAEYARQTGCPLYIVHLSCQAALDAVRHARSAGADVYVETRPAYLFLDSSVYDRPDGAKFVTWPPIRPRADQDALWGGLRCGEIQVYATDHTTWSLAQKMAPGLTFADTPGGVSNIQTSIGMLYSEGVRTGRISLSQMVALTAANPARLFGLWPRKGTLSVGADADVILFDPGKELTVRSSSMESASDFDPYEGRTVSGWPVLTMSRGEVIMCGGQVRSAAGRGELLRRGRFGAR